jgi:hypothetical protein
MNALLSLETVNVTLNDFPKMYGSMRRAADVEIKLARLDITTMDRVQIFVFRRGSHSRRARLAATSDGPGHESVLPLNPREMSGVSQLLYKWVLPIASDLRAAYERATGRAIDWSDNNERNLLLYESAIPLAKMASPLVVMNDTFVLQEYFVPEPRFKEWVAAAQPVYAATRKPNEGETPLVTLLNTTIRFVEQDDTTVRNYCAACQPHCRPHRLRLTVRLHSVSNIRYWRTLVHRAAPMRSCSTTACAARGRQTRSWRASTLPWLASASGLAAPSTSLTGTTTPRTK